MKQLFFKNNSGKYHRLLNRVGDVMPLPNSNHLLKAGNGHNRNNP